MNESDSISVSLDDRSYDVVVGADILREIGPRLTSLTGRGRAFVVYDDNLPAEFVETALGSLVEEGFEVAEATVHASEVDKSIATAHRLLNDLALTRHERRDAVIAIGGGVTGDVAGFAAAVYRRGVPIIQCPTTLLAMVDASVGGKTGVNLEIEGPHHEGSRLLKNMVGAFWQPRLVLADVDALQSLPDRHLRCGLAECLKHGLIVENAGIERDLLAWTRDNMAALLSGDAARLAELVRRNVRVKAAIVAGDEREMAADDAGGRALLNLGHTFAHVLEPLKTLSPDDDPGNAPLLHGEAVALGLCAAAACARAAGLVDDASEALVRTAVDQAKLPTKVADLPPADDLLGMMADDKKVVGGALRLVLPVESGRVRVVADPPREAILAGFEAIRR